MGRFQKPRPAITKGSLKVAAWRDKLLSSGGAILTINLSHKAVRALGRGMRHHKTPITKGAYIEGLIVKAGERRTKPR